MKTLTASTLALAAALALSGCSRSDTARPAQAAPAASPAPAAAPSNPPAAEPAAAATATATAAATPTAPPAPANAAALVPPAPNPPAGSAEAGQQIAANGGANGVTACASCHGAQGEGNPAGGFPRIAGQSSYYLAKQLTAYAKDSRQNPVMSPIAKAMSEQQIRDVSAYFAAADAPAAPPAAAPAAAAKGSKGSKGGKAAAAGIERGRRLAAVGDLDQRVQACANCHGPAGAGEAPAYPYLAGQHAGYLSAALAEWKNGARNTDASGQMPSIAKALSDQDITAVAAYYSAQQPPAPMGRTVNIPAGSAEKPAVAAAPNASGPAPGTAAPAQGVGSEQGSPLTGGSGQGIGGGGGSNEQGAGSSGDSSGPAREPNGAR